VREGERQGKGPEKEVRIESIRTEPWPRRDNFPPPTRKHLCIRSCSNKHTHVFKELEIREGPGVLRMRKTRGWTGRGQLWSEWFLGERRREEEKILGPSGISKAGHVQLDVMND
jgi:hypothetical protein